jgi:glycosyltransferase involved in cell wall biosynthesis
VATDNRVRRTGEAMPSVAIIIPTLNEERSIGRVIDSVPVADLLKNGFETAVYVIDGQSTDNTREIAVKRGAQLILEERQGKGQAIQTAFKSITADYAVMVDGDDTYPIEMATEMTRLLQTHDVVIGSRLKGTIEPGAMTTLNVVGERHPLAPRAGAVWCAHQRRVHGFLGLSKRRGSAHGARSARL